MLLSTLGLRVAYPDLSRPHLFGRPPETEILHGVDLALRAGEAVGIVGESGSGKSTLARALMRLVAPSGGSIHFEGRDITCLSEEELRPLRARMQMVFQDSQSALNPRRTVGAILAEPFLVSGRARTGSEAMEMVSALLAKVAISPELVNRYAHQLSGGQRQRVGIGRAIALDPVVIVADEIVSGLDVSVQAQILLLLAELRRSAGLALLLISHDLSVVRTCCDRVVVMEKGAVVEEGPCAQVFERPEHPYTRRLLRAIPLPVVDPSWIHEVAVDAEGSAGDKSVSEIR
jgi:peptide/nickel transport system ATP-binding protein